MASERENASSIMSGPEASPQPKPSIPHQRAPNDKKAVVIGLYGVPGSGKTFLLEQLKRELMPEHFAFYEGSKMIATLVPGGINAFQKLEEAEKLQWRKLAIDTIRKDCEDSGQVAVVTGHFMFWPEEEDTGMLVYTHNDLVTYTHILYLDILPEVVVQRLLDDTERDRPSISVAHLRKWQQAEKTQLRRLCRHHGILFSLVSLQPTMLNKVTTLLYDFRLHTEKHNMCQAENKLDEVVAASEGRVKTMLVMDADKTLAPQDTGAIFWQRVPSSSKDDTDPLKTLFSSPLRYSYTAFRQAVLLYEETADDEEFDALCQDVASSVVMYPEFVSLLKLVAEQEHVGAIVFTCGLRCVWEKVLEREGLSKEVKVIGGGRINDGFVVTPTVKAVLVDHLRNTDQMYVWAFGDSPMDLEMLCRADQAIVVVGQEETRSRTMDLDLFNLIYDGSLRPYQVVLPSNASPRLDTKMLPLVQITSGEFVDSILHCRRQDTSRIRVLDATNRNAAKLLMTPMRDATNAGPVLREAHRRVGWYLATEFLADVIGIEEHPIPHVQGHQTSGYRLCNEQQTLIVALMRGGEPMAFGVNDAFPLAVLIHAHNPNDITLHRLQGQRQVVLVDSVVNSGKTVVEFVQHVRNLNATIPIVVVAGVVQAQSVSGGSLDQTLGHAGLSVIALRLSDNKFTGRGSTDTGNRLYNTTHLP